MMKAIADRGALGYFLTRLKYEAVVENYEALVRQLDKLGEPPIINMEQTVYLRNLLLEKIGLKKLIAYETEYKTRHPDSRPELARELKIYLKEKNEVIKKCREKKLQQERHSHAFVL